jgi:hypothetical protein
VVFIGGKGLIAKLMVECRKGFYSVFNFVGFFRYERKCEQNIMQTFLKII